MENYTLFNDECLQALAARGDQLAEEQLAMRYGRLVRMCARPYFLVGGDGEDLIQEGMFGLLSAIRSYDPSMHASFKTYAEQCIKNRLFSAIRSASRKKHTPLNDGVSLDDVLSDEEQSQATFLCGPLQRDPEEQVLARERADEVFQTYSQCLSAFEKEILSLYLEGLSYREMAERTGKPVKSVDNAVQRMRQKLARYQNPGDISTD